MTMRSKLSPDEFGPLAAYRDGPLSRRKFSRNLLATVGLAAAGISLPLREALAATQVNWIGWEGYDAHFHEGTVLADKDIELIKTYITSNEEIITKLLAGGTDQFDLTTMYFGYLPLMADAGLLQPLDTSRIDNYDKLIKVFRDSDSNNFDGETWGAPWTWGSLPLMYDPAGVVEIPKSFLDVKRPEYKGKVVMIHDPLGTYITWGHVASDAKVATQLTHAQLKQVIDFLIDIKKNHARAFAQSYGEAADMFARNEVVISTQGWEAMVGFAAAKGKVIDFTYPTDRKVGAFMDMLIIPKDARQVDLAYDLLNHTLDDDIQAFIGNYLTQGVVNLDSVPLLEPASREMYMYDDMAKFGRVATFWPFPPTEPDGTHATFDDMLEEYDRLLKA